MNYYRIKQVDYDGKFSYSNIVSAMNKESIAANVFPNPVRDNLTISTAMESRMDIHSIGGLHISTHFINEGNTNISISNLNAGILYSKVR